MQYILMISIKAQASRSLFSKHYFHFILLCTERRRENCFLMMLFMWQWGPRLKLSIRFHPSHPVLFYIPPTFLIVKSSSGYQFSVSPKVNISASQNKNEIIDEVFAPISRVVATSMFWKHKNFPSVLHFSCQRWGVSRCSFSNLFEYT